MKNGKWSKASYDALFLWVAGQQQKAEQIMLADGLSNEVNVLKSMPNLGVWYRMTTTAAETVGPKIVEESAREAEKELSLI